MAHAETVLVLVETEVIFTQGLVGGEEEVDLLNLIAEVGDFFSPKLFP